jgi:hypothetical protein
MPIESEPGLRHRKKETPRLEKSGDKVYNIEQQTRIICFGAVGAKRLGGRDDVSDLGFFMRASRDCFADAASVNEFS